MKYKKILLTTGTGLLSAVLVTATLASAADLNRAVSQLPSDDEWAIMAYAAMGQNVGQSFLSQPINSGPATDYEKRILAITAIGENPASLSSENFVAKLESMFDGTQIGDSSLLNDDIFGALALASDGINNNTVAASRQYILNNQNSDGGWGFAKGGSSDSNMTAMAVAALAGSAPSSAINYLQQSQDNSGGYGFTPGTPADGASTAWVIMGLNAAGGAPSEAKKFLENLQLPNGSFKWKPTDSSGSALVTAYAVIALSGNTLPIRVVSAPVPTPTPAPSPMPTPMPSPTPTPSLVGTCLVPIFHTNFPLPPEGGKIIQKDGQLYFARTYLSGCHDTGNATPSVHAPTPSPSSNLSSDLIGTCLVPIFHTDFAFPPEGGKIVEKDGQKYFVRTYLSGCSDTTGGNPVTPPAASSVNLSVRYNQTTIFSSMVNWSTNSTALSILTAAGQSQNFTVQTRSTTLGAYVSAINGYSASGLNGWQYAINGVVPSIGADQATLHANDTLQWFYGAPGTAPY